MATELTAEELAQRAVDVDVVSQTELQSIWSELGTRAVETAQLKQLLLRRGLLTNYQLDRIEQGFRTGFFYGDYKVLYLVGAGTYARVYRATHRKTSALFAIKVLRKRMSEKPKEAEMFRREGELGMGLQHPNIVAIHEVQSKGLVHFIIMDFVEGHNLREFAKIRSKFKPKEAAHIASGIMAGLNYAFRKGVTHRDLKMSNIIVSSEGEAKLVDFGLAGLGGGDADEAGDGMNPRTIDYAGLERATNVRKDDTRSDIFFAGAIFYQMLCGVPAISETRERVQRLDKSRFQNIRPIIDIDPKLPMPLVLVVNKALEFDPDRRYQTSAEMLTDIKIAVRRIEQNTTAVDTPQENVPQEGHDAQGQSRKLMIVESDTKMQDLFRTLFKKRGYRVLVTNNPDRLFQRFYDDPKTADVVLLSSGNLGAELTLKAFARLGEEPATKNVPAVLLLGDQHEKFRKKIKTTSHQLVVQMPLKSRELRKAILKVLK